MIFGLDEGIYSTYKANKGWKFKDVKYKEYPLPLWSQKTKFEIQPNNKISKYWLLFRTKLKNGGIWVPFHTKQTIPTNGKLLDSFMIKNNKGNYEIKLIYEIPSIEPINASKILAVDLGEKVMATVCGSNGFRKMYGNEIRGIRRHYCYLRKQLGRNKLTTKVKFVGCKERNIVNGILHRITKEIVNDAINLNNIIVVGDLKGIRNSAKGKGARLNRIVSNFSYYKFIKLLTYKASMKGIKVIKISEKGTSKTCHRCESEGKRPFQGLFKCPSCKLEYNADYNSALNILNRFKEYTSLNGAFGSMPKNPSLLVNG